MARRAGDELTARRAARRWGHVLAWLTVALVVTGLLEVMLPGDISWGRHASLTLAYTSLAALLVSLSIGPFNVLTSRRNPTSTDLRRDSGLVAALTGVGHTVISLTNHFGGRIALYFFSDGSVSLASVRRDAFGIGAWTGLGATVVVVGLAAISSDAAMRRLGRRRWKRLQRCNYALAVVVVVHSVALWIGLQRGQKIVVAAAGAVAVMAALQFAGASRTLAARRRS